MAFCEVCNPADYDNPQWLAIHTELESYSIDKHVFRHTNGGHIYRKGWEWTQCLYALEQLGAIQPSVSALGVGAGHEPVLFYLADRIDSVYGLDLYGNEGWSSTGGREADAGILTNPHQYCPRPANFSRLRLVNGSGCELNFDNNSFDFCWSLSSIEHFGGHAAAGEAVAQMGYATKPGGFVVVATEYLLLPEYWHPEYFNREDINELIAAAPNLQLVSEIEWNTLAPEYLIDSVPVPHGADRIRRHVVLNDGQVQWTSILLVFRKST
jgi:SAM-dependent methyltransferase